MLWALLVLCMAIYGIGNEIGEWRLKMLQRTGGLVTAREILNAQYAGAILGAAAFILGLLFIFSGKGGRYDD